MLNLSWEKCLGASVAQEPVVLCSAFRIWQYDGSNHDAGKSDNPVILPNNKGAHLQCEWLRTTLGQTTAVLRQKREAVMAESRALCRAFVGRSGAGSLYCTA